MSALTVGSLFSGIGGLELGLERAGMRVAFQVEKEPYCRAVLAKHWPNVPRFDDVRTVGAHNLPRVDVICGGFPCQDVSVAGQRAGIKEGTRSGLWIEYARIIGELRPRYVVVENVPGLLSDGMGRVLGDLAALGYDAEWSVLSACAVGAPHTRERLFIVAYPHREGLAQRLVFAGSAGRQGRALTREAAPVGDRWSGQSPVCRVAHGVPRRVDRVRALGNAVVPEVAEYVGRLVVAASGAQAPARAA